MRHWLWVCNDGNNDKTLTRRTYSVIHLEVKTTVTFDLKSVLKVNFKSPIPANVGYIQTYSMDNNNNPRTKKLVRRDRALLSCPHESETGLLCRLHNSR